MRTCPVCKKLKVIDTPLGEVCTNDECGYVDGMDLGPRNKVKKPLTQLEQARREIARLEKRIWNLEHQDHCCGSCGNVTRPSHPADGC